MNVNLYLHFAGDCEAALRFYERALGGKIDYLATWGDSPAAAQAPPGWEKKILHGRIKIGDQVVFAADAPGQQAHSGFGVSLTARDEAEAERSFQALAEGGKITMPLGPTFFAARFGMVADRFGVPWIVIAGARAH